MRDYFSEHPQDLAANAIVRKEWGEKPLICFAVEGYLKCEPSREEEAKRSLDLFLDNDEARMLLTAKLDRVMSVIKDFEDLVGKERRKF